MTHPLPGYSTELPATADVAIVGGGILGAAAAYFCGRAGLSCVVLERRPMIGTLNTSAATGAFRAQFDNPDELALVRESIAFFERFGDETGLEGWDLGIRRQGYLWIATSEATASRQRELVARQAAWGLDDVEIVSAHELGARWPYLAPIALQARFRAGDGWLDPKRLTAGYAAASGGRFVLETEVEALDVHAGSVRGVRTSRGRVASAAVVLAAGPFSLALASTAGLTMQLKAVRRQRLVLPEVPEVPPEAPMTIDEETGAHWRPALRGANVMWTTADEVSEPPLDGAPPREDWAFRVLDPRSPDAIARLTPFWAEVWKRGDLHWFARAGQYDCTPDHKPYVGATPVPGLFVSCGSSGHGIMTSAGLGRRVADSIAGRLEHADNPFRVDRPFDERSRDLL